ncbi:MAG: hypothetical protein HRU20_28040, partial [Pseudomonadales bacterium]|nr:hypothetical protein [Pseudomonadales bacterium]
QADVNAGVKAAVNPAITSAGFPWLAALFFIAVLLFAVFFHKPYTPGDVASPAAAVLPEALHSQGIALTDVEDRFFSSKQAQANKYRFDFEGVNGRSVNC